MCGKSWSLLLAKTSVFQHWHKKSSCFVRIWGWDGAQSFLWQIWAPGSHDRQLFALIHHLSWSAGSTFSHIWDSQSAVLKDALFWWLLYKSSFWGDGLFNTNRWFLLESLVGFFFFISGWMLWGQILCEKQSKAQRSSSWQNLLKSFLH